MGKTRRRAGDARRRRRQRASGAKQTKRGCHLVCHLYVLNPLIAAQMDIEGNTGITSEKPVYKYSTVPIRGGDGEFMSVETSYVDEEEAFRDCIKAILEGDADALADVVG